nr:hypothetical protein Q903MT_gene1299 [Picea sitchensis]
MRTSHPSSPHLLASHPSKLSLYYLRFVGTAFGPFTIYFTQQPTLLLPTLSTHQTHYL